MSDLSSWFAENLDIIGFAVGILGILLAIYYGRKAHKHQRKTLDWELKADEALVHPAAGPVNSALTVSVGATEVKDPRIISLRIVNTGKQPIAASDYTKPITIDVPDANIAEAIITSVSDPEVLELRSIRYDYAEPNASLEEVISKPVSLKPALLNPGDWLELQLIVMGSKGVPNVSTRFAGQSSPMLNLQFRQIRRSNIRIGISGLLITIPTIIFLYFVRYAVGIGNDPRFSTLGDESLSKGLNAGWAFGILTGLLVAACIWSFVKFVRALWQQLELGRIRRMRSS